MLPARVTNMAVQLSLLALLVLSLSLGLIDGDSLWCYECNTNLREGHKSECNDPYTAIPSTDLVACGQGPHHCLKSVVLHRNVLVTVRGCVPSYQIDNYCKFPNSPEAIIECYFCKDYACNRQTSIKQNTLTNVGLLIFTLIVLLKIV